MVIKFNGFIYDLTEKDAVDCLQKEINKMYAENEKLKTEIALLEEQDGQYHNQLAIECLKEVKEVAEKKLSELEDYKAKIYMGLFLYNIEDFIDNKIKELEEGK